MNIQCSEHGQVTGLRIGVSTYMCNVCYGVSLYGKYVELNGFKGEVAGVMSDGSVSIRFDGEVNDNLVAPWRLGSSISGSHQLVYGAKEEK